VPTTDARTFTRLAFEQPEHNSLGRRPATVNLFGPLVRVHIPSLATDESFVRFDRARHFVDRSVVHRISDAMHHKPRRLLSHLKSAGNLVRGNAILAVRQHPHRAKPLVETNGRILEDRTDLNRVLLFAFFALPHQASRQKRRLLAGAARADRLALGPFHRSNFLDTRQRVTVVRYRTHQTAVFADVFHFYDSSVCQEKR
jgi:hypothetical protein